MVAYVLRGRELLVFEHGAFPDAGTQVPAGTVEEHEAAEVAVVREVREETGLDTRLVRELGVTDEIAPRGEPRRNIFSSSKQRSHATCGSTSCSVVAATTGSSLSADSSRSHRDRR